MNEWINEWMNEMTWNEMNWMNEWKEGLNELIEGYALKWKWTERNAKWMNWKHGMSEGVRGWKNEWTKWMN